MTERGALRGGRATASRLAVPMLVFFDRINASLFSFGKMVSATLQRNRIYRIALRMFSQRRRDFFDIVN